MVGVIVDDDVVTVPQPVADVACIEWGNAEVESAEPEAAGTATDEAPAVARAESSFETAVFPRMVEVEPGVIPSLIVADPLVIVKVTVSFGAE